MMHGAYSVKLNKVNLRERVCKNVDCIYLICSKYCSKDCTRGVDGEGWLSTAL